MRPISRAESSSYRLQLLGFVNRDLRRQGRDPHAVPRGKRQHTGDWIAGKVPRLSVGPV